MKFQHYSGSIYRYIVENGICKVYLSNNNDDYVEYTETEFARNISIGVWQVIA